MKATIDVIKLLLESDVFECFALNSKKLSVQVAAPQSYRNCSHNAKPPLRSLSLTMNLIVACTAPAY